MQLFGFMGMIIGVPIFAVIYAFISGWLKVRLAKRKMPVETTAYGDLAYVSEETDKMLSFEDVAASGMNMQDIFLKRIERNQAEGRPELKNSGDRTEHKVGLDANESEASKPEEKTRSSRS